MGRRNEVATEIDALLTTTANKEPLAMPHLSALIEALLRDREGVTALEYGMIYSVLIGFIMLGFNVLGGSLGDTFNFIGNAL